MGNLFRLVFTSTMLVDVCLCFLSLLLAAVLMGGTPPLSELVLLASGVALFMAVMLACLGVDRTVGLGIPAVLTRTIAASMLGACLVYVTFEGEGSQAYGERLLNLGFAYLVGGIVLRKAGERWLNGNVTRGATKALLKRAFDVTGALALLIMAMPLMLLAAIAVGLDSPGPVIHRQQRVGLRGRVFTCLRFRSMRLEAECDGMARWASKRASRITRVGAFIQRARIDELPQLFSVLRGDMSLVGPRPETPSLVESLRKEIPQYDVRHAVKPGMTGWAQVRYGGGVSVEDARRTHELDLYYVKNNSLVVDLLVLVETVSVVLSREGR